MPSAVRFLLAFDVPDKYKLFQFESELPKLRTTSVEGISEREKEILSVFS